MAALDSQSNAGRKARRIVTPLQLQMHATECAAACLCSVLAYFGRWVPLVELRDRCEVGRDGSTAAGVVRAARSYGLECRGFLEDSERLKQRSLPLILFWEFNHFLILEGYDRDWFFLNDPASGRRKVSAEEFGKFYTGVALAFNLTPEFQRSGVRTGLLQRIRPWLRSVRDALAYVIGCGLLLVVLSLATPALLAIYVDQVLGTHEPWGGLVAGALAAAAVLVYGLVWLKQRYLRHLATRVSVTAWNRCVSRLLRLPVNYFNHRLAGELAARIMSIDKIATSLSDHFIGVLVEIGMSTVLLAVMFAYEPMLALVVLGLAVLNALLLRAVLHVRADKSHALRREQGLLLGVGTLMLQHAGILRMNALDDRFFARWSGHQACELGARQRFSELGHISAALPGLFTMFGSVVVLAIGGSQVVAHEMTLGTLVGFYILVAMFLEPIGRFVGLAGEIQALEIDMQRLEDITEAPEAPRRQQASRSIATLNRRLRLAGHVELRNVTFGYNRNRPPLIKDFNLVIKPGQRIAVVGPSGSGKSTLAHLISGLYQPWSGEILFDGHPRHEIPDEVLSRSLATVDQNITLFSATVRDNITLWSAAVPDEILIAAAKDACIHDDILSRPLGYSMLVDEGGNNFSGGQRQRLEIARALVGIPTVLVLDEATSALDAATESRIDNALRRRGTSCLIVAHRLSTIRDCDEIIVFEKGVGMQRGTHDELMANKDGSYARLARAG